MSRISVLIPAYNEASSLEVILPDLPKAIAGRTVVPLVICDGSSDGTCRVAIEHSVEVVRMGVNAGKGAALRSGMAQLTGREFEAVVVMDGDGQHTPEDMEALATPVLDGEADIVVGSRYLNNPGRGNSPLNRYLVRSVFTRILRKRLSQPVTDPFSGYRCLSTSALEYVTLEGNRYEGELEVRFEAELHGFRLREVPIRRIYGEGQSKMADTGGRMNVIRGYVSTLRRKTRELQAKPHSARYLAVHD